MGFPYDPFTLAAASDTAACGRLMSVPENRKFSISALAHLFTDQAAV